MRELLKDNEVHFMKLQRQSLQTSRIVPRPLVLCLLHVVV